ncbi:hypothetical protein BDZ91DRAFT_764129 [Kalaharituber pfeilii]|nr:hypothetical protein BDZ91DRAFT_764129 [Kalaharituber pfeilii]
MNIHPMQHLCPLTLPPHGHQIQPSHNPYAQAPHAPQPYAHLQPSSGGGPPLDPASIAAAYYSHPQTSPSTAAPTPLSATAPVPPYQYPPPPSANSAAGPADYPSQTAPYPPFKRKAIRAAQACDACRARKAKCDEGRPACGFCKETAITCVYREVPPPKQDRTLLEILARLGRIEGLLGGQQQAPGAADGNAAVPAPTVEAPMVSPAPVPVPVSVPAPPNPGEKPLAEDEELTIPYQHTTAAHKLLWWESIRELVGEEYARGEGYGAGRRGGVGPGIGAEANAGAGSGGWFEEGEDLEMDYVAGIDGPGVGAGAMWNVPWSDGEVFGEDDEQEGGDEVGTQGNNRAGGERASMGQGGLLPDGTLRLDPETVLGYLDSYLSNIHILHPILDKGTISRVVREFLGRVHVHAGTGGGGGGGVQGRATVGGDGASVQGGGASQASIPTSYVPEGPPGPGGMQRKPPLPVTGKRKRSASMSMGGGAVNVNGAAAGAAGTQQGRPGMHSRSSSTSGRSPPTISAPHHGMPPLVGQHHQRQRQQQQAPLPTPGAPPPQRIPRTIHSAIVLLVVALGCICLHRAPVPGPLPPIFNISTASASTSSPTSAFTPPSPAYHRHPSINPYAATPPPPNPTTISPPPPLPRNILPRNIDVTPGLAYFAKAMEILGILFGGNDVAHVQAGLLAGLYWGQLGRVLDSWKWISWACMGCQVLVRMKLQQQAENAKLDKVERDLILRLFWSCLQLERFWSCKKGKSPDDPATNGFGISRLEDSMLLPSGHATDASDVDVREDDPLMWMYYLAQIALRKLLNRAHTALYKQHINRTAADTSRSLAIARELDFQLEQWKLALPVPLRWGEGDPPSSDINAARLRAKYFGARYIIHRPFVYHAVHGWLSQAGTSPVPRNAEGGAGAGSPGSVVGTPKRELGGEAGRIRSVTPPGKGGAGVGVSGTGAGGGAGAGVPGGGSGGSGGSGDALMEASCRKCLDSAVQSTIAFHAFSASQNRPIITNVFGTAHALTCSGSCFQKTMFFLGTLAPISAGLRRDLEILRHVAGVLGGEVGVVGQGKEW